MSQRETSGTWKKPVVEDMVRLGQTPEIFRRSNSGVQLGKARVMVSGESWEH